MGKLEAQQMKLLEKRVAFLERVVDALLLNTPAAPPPAVLAPVPTATVTPTRAGDKDDDSKDAKLSQWRRRTTAA